MRRRLPRRSARGRRLRRRSGIWRRQLLSLLGCRWRCAGAHCSTNRCMGQAVRDGLRASKPAVYASPSIFLVTSYLILPLPWSLSLLCENVTGGRGTEEQEV